MLMKRMTKRLMLALTTALLATLPSNPAWVSRYIHQVLLYRRPHA